jgi:hypothetical protein
MAGSINFNVTVYVKGGEAPTLMASRLSDLSDFFNTVIGEWSRDNEEKFSAGVGAEATGVNVDPGIFWRPLSPSYLKEKESEGLAGALMVRTGSLKSSLSDPNLLIREVGTDRAIFGEPLDPFDALKVSENWDSRQAVFFSGRDQMMIKEKLIKHLDPDQYGGIPYSDTKAEIDRMDAEFEGLTGASNE